MGSSHYTRQWALSPASAGMTALFHVKKCWTHYTDAMGSINPFYMSTLEAGCEITCLKDHRAREPWLKREGTP